MEKVTYALQFQSAKLAILLLSANLISPFAVVARPW